MQDLRDFFTGLPIRFPSRVAGQRWLTAALLLLAGSLASHGQALPTASRAGDLQVGGGFVWASSDFASAGSDDAKLKGGGFYTAFDFRKHFGVELDFHQVNDSKSALYERTYEVGGRYLLHPYGIMSPYIKAMYGRGVLNYPAPNEGSNIAYNMFVGGGGADFRIRSHFSVRGDFEYQYWLSGIGIPNGLTPMVVEGGVAYHIGRIKPAGLQWKASEFHAERAPRSQPPPPPPPVESAPPPPAEAAPAPPADAAPAQPAPAQPSAPPPSAN